MSLKLYYDAGSQPSRSVYMLLKAGNVPFTPKIVKIMSADHTTEEYEKICPAKIVPCIVDNNFNLFESVAIMKYVVSKYKLDDHWYPADLHRRAKIDEYLHWHSANTRFGCALYFQELVIKPKLGKQPDEGQLKKLRRKIDNSASLLDKHFLAGKKFIGGNEISIADLLAVCEFSQLTVLQKKDIPEYPAGVTNWFERCKDRLQPHFDDGHAMIYRIASMLNSNL